MNAKKLTSFIFSLIVIFILSSELNSQTGWVSLNTGTTSYLTSLFFIDANTGYIGGMNGYLAKTTNAGSNWTTLSSGMSGFVRSMDFINTNTGYICGDNSVLMKTTNGGSNWTPLSTGGTGTFYAVDAPSDVNVFFCNVEGKVYRSTNAGSSWSFVQVHTGSLLSIDFPSAETGYSAGLTGAVYKTTNAGLNWTTFNSYTTNNIWDLSFVNNNLGWFNAYYGTIRKTLDGTNFIPDFGYNYNFEGISAINEMIAYSCGLSGVLMKTTNGGVKWFIQQSGTNEGLNEIFMLNANTGFVVGSGGKFLKTTDGGSGVTQFLNILSPNGGEVFQYGYVEKIKWTANGPVNVSLQYTTDNGSSWNNIVSSLPANNFEYNWTIPSFSSTNVKVRINDLGSSLTDVSDNTFKITDANHYLYKVPEILYLKFNNGSLTTPNYAKPGNGTQQAYITGHTIGYPGWYDSCLIGAGNTGSTHRVTDSSVLYLPPTGWTIGFWISNIQLGATVTNPVYLFGEVTSNFRIYYGGSGGIGPSDTAIMLRMTGGADVRVPVVKGLSYYIYFSWDASTQSIKAYRNGMLVVSVSQTGFSGIGNGPITIGAHTTFASSLSTGMKLDEFRIYGRTLSVSDIQVTSENTLPKEIYQGITPINNEIPDKFELKQNYPNPFNPVTSIIFDIPKRSFVKLSIYNFLGQEIELLVNKEMIAGSYKADWNASGIASGVYFYKLESGSFSETKKMILLK
jgi:photosystem II stability/assembly factor-like uncharacterized protein